MSIRQAQWNVAVPNQLWHRLEDYLDRHPEANRSALIRAAVELWLDGEDLPDPPDTNEFYTLNRKDYEKD